MKSRKSIKYKVGLLDAVSTYETYPHKRNFYYENGRHSAPYIKKKDVSDSPLALAQVEYIKILETFADKAIKHLMEGESFILHPLFGALVMEKYRSDGRNHKKIREKGKFKRIRNTHTFGYKPKLSFRPLKSKIASYWKINPTKKVAKYWGQVYKKNGASIYKLNTGHAYYKKR